MANFSLEQVGRTRLRYAGCDGVIIRRTVNESALRKQAVILVKVTPTPIILLSKLKDKHLHDRDGD